MKSLQLSQVTTFVEKNIGSFHSARLQRLRELRLDEVLRRKNPYLFRAKNILMAQDLVKVVLDAHLSSQEEGIFGGFLEGLAIFINGKVYGGTKSSAEGIDLEFELEHKRYIVTIKSGPNWGNSGQIRKMREDFKRAAKILRTTNSGIDIVAVNGCCYGRDRNPDKGDYFKYCGQVFWEFISGDKGLYVDLIEPLGHKAKERNNEFVGEYSQIVNKFTLEFGQRFCVGGKIDWDALVRFNSSAEKPN